MSVQGSLTSLGQINLDQLKELTGANAALKGLNDQVRTMTSALAPMLRALNDTASATTKLAQGAGQAQQATAKLHKEAKTLGGGLTEVAARAMVLTRAFGAVARALSAPLTAAMGLENQLTTLRRVSGMTADVAKYLGEQLDRVALAATAVDLKEVYGVAEFVARMGVGGDLEGQAQADAIAGVTSALAKLKLVIDMPLEEAATQMMRVQNVMGQGVDKTLNFASALTAIDNASTATASELLNMTSEMSGTMSTLRVATADTIALAGAMRDAGGDAGAATTAITTLMNRMSADSAKFARAVGMDVRRLALLMKTDPLTALSEWLAALKRFAPEAQNQILLALKMGGRLTGQKILQMAPKLDPAALSRYRELANREYASLGAIGGAEGLAAETSAAQLQKLGVEVRYLAKELGERLNPTWKATLTLLREVAGATIKFVTDTEGPVQKWAADLAKAIAGLKDDVAAAMDVLRDVVVTWQFAWQEATLRIGKGVGDVVAGFRWMAQASVSLFEWMRDNWRTIAADMVTIGGQTAKFLGESMVFMVKGTLKFPEVLKSLFQDKDTQKRVWKEFMDLTMGFEKAGNQIGVGALTPAPKIPGIDLGHRGVFDQQIADLHRRGGAALLADWARRAGAPPGLAGMPAAKAPGARGAGGAELGEAGAQGGRVSLLEMADRLQKAAFAAGGDPQKETARNTKALAGEAKEAKQDRKAQVALLQKNIEETARVNRELMKGVPAVYGD